MSGTPDASLELNLCGERFRLRAGPGSHERLRQVAERVNQRIDELRKGGGALTLQRASLMAAFQFAYEFEELGGRVELSGDERDAMTQKIDDLIGMIDENLSGLAE